jgi:hypothetical protein
MVNTPKMSRPPFAARHGRFCAVVFPRRLQLALRGGRLGEGNALKLKACGIAKDG